MPFRRLYHRNRCGKRSAPGELAPYFTPALRSRRRSSIRPCERMVVSMSAAPSRPESPVAPRRTHSFTHHGITLTDDYTWLKDARWQEVLRVPSLLDADIRQYLEAENAHADALLGPTAALQTKLVAEMRGRIQEDD